MSLVVYFRAVVALSFAAAGQNAPTTQTSVIDGPQHYVSILADASHEAAARRAAAEALLRSSTPQARELVLSILQGTCTESARLALCEALAQAESPDSAYIPALVRVVRPAESAGQG